MPRERVFKRDAKPPGWFQIRDVQPFACVAKRQLAEDVNHFFTGRHVVFDVLRAMARNRHRAIAENQIGVRLHHRQSAGRAHARAGRDADLRPAVVDRERGNVRTLAVLKIVNRQAGGGRLAMKKSRVGDEVAGHATDAGVRERRNKGFEYVPEIGAESPGIPRRVAVADDNQIAVNCAGPIWFCRRVNRRENFVIAAEAVPKQARR